MQSQGIYCCTLIFFAQLLYCIVHALGYKSAARRRFPPLGRQVVLPKFLGVTVSVSLHVTFSSYNIKTRKPRKKGVVQHANTLVLKQIYQNKKLAWHEIRVCHGVVGR